MTGRTLFKSFYIFIIFIITSYLYTQNLVDKVALAGRDNTVIEIFENSETGEIFRVFSNDMGPMIIEQGTAAGTLTKKFLDGIIWENGKQLTFAKGERFLSFANDHIFTSKEVWNNDTREYCNEIKKYTILQRSLLELDKKLTVKKNNQINILSNGNIVTTDFHDFYGTEISIYTSNFKFLDSYNPYMLGFKKITFADNGKVILFVVYPTRSNKNMLKLLFINFENGNLIREKEIYNNFTASRIFPFGNLFVIYGDGWFNAINNKGNIVWDRRFDKPLSVIDNKLDKSICVLTSEKIFSLKKKNGSTKWSKDIFSIYSIKMDEELEKVTDINIQPLGIYNIFDNESVGLIVGQTRGFVSVDKLKYNTVLYIINNKGKTEKVIDCCRKTYMTKIVNHNNYFKLVTDNESVEYKK
ncbi:MAG: hypothetical protein KAU01_03580 [Candidatus Cloacimonetes bacterium]|nr:hypothetical protein [Candidatus Cloacimonadota bacterium]